MILLNFKRQIYRPALFIIFKFLNGFGSSSRPRAISVRQHPKPFALIKKDLYNPLFTSRSVFYFIN